MPVGVTFQCIAFDLFLGADLVVLMALVALGAGHPLGFCLLSMFCCWQEAWGTKEIAITTRIVVMTS